MGHGLGPDLPRHQPGSRADADHRRRPRQGEAPGQPGPLLRPGERRLGAEDVLRKDVGVLPQSPRGRLVQRQLRLRLPTLVLLRDGRQRLVSTGCCFGIGFFSFSDRWR